jgi:hypothetical protein
MLLKRGNPIFYAEPAFEGAVKYPALLYLDAITIFPA